MKRTCPNCQNTLGKHENYFCLSCGHKLEDNLVQYTPTFVSTVKKFASEPISIVPHFKFEIHIEKRLKLLFLLVLGLGLFSLAVIFATDKLSQVKKESIFEKASVVEETVTYNNTENINLIVENFRFGTESMIDLIPVNISFMVEGQNFDETYELFYNTKRGPAVFPEIIHELKGPYVAFGYFLDNKWEYGLISSFSGELPDPVTEITEAEEQEQDIETAEEDTPAQTDEEDTTNEEIETQLFHYAVISNSLVITTSEDLLGLVEEAAKGQTKTVKHNPKYSSFSAYLPKDGQVRFMNFTENFELVSNILDSYSPSDEARIMLEPVLSAEYNKFVIRKNE